LFPFCSLAAAWNFDAISLQVASFQSSGPLAPAAARVFAGTTEVFRNGAGEYVVPLRNGSGQVITDALDPSKLAASTVPKGAFVVVRRGNGVVVSGLSGYMKPTSRVAMEATTQVVGGLQGQERNMSFERQGDGLATLGTPSQDEFFRELNAVVRMKTTVNVAADLMSQKACQ